MELNGLVHGLRKEAGGVSNQINPTQHSQSPTAFHRKLSIKNQRLILCGTLWPSVNAVLKKNTLLTPQIIQCRLCFWMPLFSSLLKPFQRFLATFFSPILVAIEHDS
jgi:hypothetical protein